MRSSLLLTSKLLPAGLHAPIMPAPIILMHFPDLRRALHAFGDVGLSGASGILSTGSIRKAARYWSSPTHRQASLLNRMLLQVAE